MIFDYIESFYNPRRRHSALGYRSPAQRGGVAVHAARGLFWGGSKGGETCLTEQVGSSRPAVNNSVGVVQRRKQPANHQRAFKQQPNY